MLTPEIQALMDNAKAKREAAGLKSTYRNIDTGEVYDVYHAIPEQKAFKDRLHEAREQYGESANFPQDVMDELAELNKVFEKAYWK